jgi:hypothetical protein
MNPSGLTSFSSPRLSITKEMFIILWVEPLVAQFLLNLAMTNMSYHIAENITMVESFLPVAILGGGRISLLVGLGGTEYMTQGIICRVKKIRKGFTKT